MQAAVGGDRLLHQGTNNLRLSGLLEDKRGVPTWGNYRGRAEPAMSGDVHLKCRASEAAGRTNIGEMTQTGSTWRTRMKNLYPYSKMGGQNKIQLTDMFRVLCGMFKNN